MDKGKGIATESEEAKTNGLFVSSAAFHDDIVKLLDVIERSKNEIDSTASYDMDRLEQMKLNLTILLRIFQFSYPDFDAFKATISRELYDIQSRDDVENAIVRLLVCFDSCMSATMTWEQLGELLDSIFFMKLHDLSSVESFFPLMAQYEVLQNICRNIRDIHGLRVNGCIESEILEYVISQFQLMAKRIGHFCWVVLADQFNKFVCFLYKRVDLPRVDVTLANLLVELIPFQLEVMLICFTKLRASKSAEVGRFIKLLLEATPDILREYLIHLEIHMVNVTSSNPSARKIHVIVEFLLLILTDMPMDFIYLDKLVDLLAHVVEVTKEVSILVRRLEDKSRDEECANEINCAIVDLLENIELLKGELEMAYLRTPDPSEHCFHMSDGPLFMSSFLGHLKGLLNSNAYSVDLIKEEIGVVMECLEFIKSFFGKVEQELYIDLWKHVLNLAYETNYVINSILVRDDGLLHIIFSLPNVIEKIKLIKVEVSNFHENIPKNSGPILKKSVKNKSFIAGQIFVGFEEEKDWIIRKLTKGPAELDVISIIGMPGLGKTTLAYNVYNDRSVTSHFDICAWCTIEQEYDRKIILQKILNQVTGLDEKFKDDTDFDDMLRKKLYGRRYLIVLDDLWDIASWDDLTSPFPQVEKGSRIILTSRNKEVALQGKRHSDLLDLRLLRLEESWELLEKRVFQEESCPIELLDVGKQIAQNCKGLPLVVDLIAGVLEKSQKEKVVWFELLKDLNSAISKEEEVMKVIQLSYDQLTDHLKLCFLYLGSYKKDEQIRVDELKAIWSALGFVEEIEMQSAEEVVEDYLDHLVSSSLVMVSMVFTGKNREKVVQIHDLIHDFCLITARTEKMFDLISSYLMPRQLIIHYDTNLPQSYKNMYFEHLHFHIYHIRHFRLLRVLTITSGYIEKKDYLLNKIAMLVHLRYLKIQTSGIKALPLSFSNLLNLETLMVNNPGTPLSLLPVIRSLVMLRHVEINQCCLYNMETYEPALYEEDTKFENLRILKQLVISWYDGSVIISKKFPNLQKLDCEVYDSGWCNWFPQFGFLNELEELTVRRDALPIEDNSNPNDIMSLCESSFFPLSLRYLELVHGLVNSDALSTIARLPNLEELRLFRICIQEKKWKMRDSNTFKNLKLLNVWRVSFYEWHVGEESFPVLQRLMLRHCRELKRIPPSFGDIYSLKTIELIDNPQLEESAQEIKRYVEDYTGEDKLEVIVIRL